MPNMKLMAFRANKLFFKMENRQLTLLPFL